MHFIFEAGSTVFVAYICLVRPFLTERLARRSDGRLKSEFRVAFYRRSIMFKAGSLAFVTVLMAATGQPLGGLVRVSDAVPLWPSGFALIVLIITLQILIMTALLNRFAKLRHFLVIGLGSVFLSYGIIPVMIVHALVDLRVALLAPERRSARRA